MKTQVKTSTSSHKRTIKPKQKPGRLKKSVKPNLTGNVELKPKPSAKTGLKKKVVKKRKLVKKVSKKKVIKKGMKKEDEKLPDDVKWLEDDPHDEILSRFVFNTKGTQIGETIGVEGRQLILKNGKKFYSIPLKFVHEKNDELILKKNINWDQAERKGEKWRKKALDVIKPKK